MLQKSGEEAIQSYQEIFNKINEFVKNHDSSGKKYGSRYFYRGMYLRTALSLLIDGDWTDTACFFQDIPLSKRISQEETQEIWQKCIHNFEEYLKNEKTIVVSVHQNSFTSENVKGAQVFYYRNSAGGTELAKIMQTILNDNININNKKEIKENTSYYMLLHTKCPTIIVECGFLSNWDDANNLSSDDYQKRMAGLICKGIEEYLKK